MPLLEKCRYEVVSRTSIKLAFTHIQYDIVYFVLNHKGSKQLHTLSNGKYKST